MPQTGRTCEVGSHWPTADQDHDAVRPQRLLLARWLTPRMPWVEGTSGQVEVAELLGKRSVIAGTGCPSYAIRPEVSRRVGSWAIPEPGGSGRRPQLPSPVCLTWS